MARKIAAVVFSLSCLQAGSVMALGLGELKLESFLNQPLNARVDLLNMGNLHQDEVKVRLATREDFDKLGLDRVYFLTNITFEVLPDGKGGAQIVLSSENPVLEPYLDFVVEARWPTGRLLREYTVLVDPPVFSDAAMVVSASERVAEVDNIPAPEKKRTIESSAAGTQVDVRRTDLPAGAMPQRDYNSRTALSPEPGSRYMVSRDQTLWSIASQAKPEGASVHQTMLDIQRLNPNAFINGNINRIKAGYIIYLPSARDISSGDLSGALAEVSEQNAAWREGRDAQYDASDGPSLSISADESTGDVQSSGSGAEASATGAPKMMQDPDSEEGTDSAEGAESAEGEDSAEGEETAESDAATVASVAAQEQITSMEYQLKTLERIITLKNEQISALQSVLADGENTVVADSIDAGGLDDAFEESVDLGAEINAENAFANEPMPEATPEEIIVMEEQVDPAASAVIDKPAAPADPKAAAATPKPEVSDGGWIDYLWYVLGAVVLAIAGLVMLRRRGDSTDDDGPALREADNDDIFSDVQLTEQPLELEPQAVEAEEEKEVEEEGAKAAPRSNNRGYGVRKHDEYASDVDAADALAEADIYIAYGRHPQAIDLLNNALANEPGNPVYRLKLLEIHTELNDPGAAALQLEKLREIGDEDSIARAEALTADVDSDAVVEPGVSPAVALNPSNDGPGLVPNPLKLMSETDADLEADFSGLEIEGADSSAEEAGELDLSSDFAAGIADDSDEEALVIAADENGLATKLDLARAYMDMGDDEGARQILDEVVADGSEELKTEAQALLERIGG
ncbi:MAG: FimV/HubP family polar landmark protein [Halioglobus sp.]|nr:FimV/HubP family polar landmark protein [Halioglobus sp.]